MREESNFVNSKDKTGRGDRTVVIGNISTLSCSDHRLESLEQLHLNSSSSYQYMGMRLHGMQLRAVTDQRGGGLRASQRSGSCLAWPSYICVPKFQSFSGNSIVKLRPNRLRKVMSGVKTQS